MDNVTRQLAPVISTQLSQMSELKTSFQQFKNNWRQNSGAKVKSEKSKNNSSDFEGNLEENFAEEKVIVGKLEKIENEIREKQKYFEDETNQKFTELKGDISNAIFRNISRDFAAKTDNGTDVMKSVYSVIHSLGEGLKRMNGKQRIDSGAISRFLCQK
jgi:signal recognition particle GTPase